MSRADTYHLRWRGKVVGPLSWQEIERKLNAHEIGLLHDLQHNNDWTTLGDYLVLRGEIMRVAPNAHAVPAPSGADFKTGGAVPLPRKVRVPNRWIFVALGLVSGFLGLHDFYAGHWIRGAILLVSAVLFWKLDLGIIIPWVVAMAEIVLTKVDGKGRRMSWKWRPPKT